MKHEERTQRLAKEKRQTDRLAQAPPYFECSHVQWDDKDSCTVHKLQTTRDIINLFPWAEDLIVPCESNFELKLVDGYEIVKIRREV